MKYSRSKKWKRRDSILLLERLELYVSSGLAIDRALAIAGQGIPHHQRSALGDVERRVVSGSRVSNALSTYIGIPGTIAGIIEHGESSGQLAQAFGTARTLMEKGDDLYKRCISAFIYPTVIGLFALVLTIGLVQGVMPQIIPLLKGLQVDLPVLTRVVIVFSDSLTAYGIYLVACLIGVVISFRVIYKRLYMIRRIVHRSVLSLPLIGQLLTMYSWSLFLHSCGTLVDAGISVADAYDKTAGYVYWCPIREGLLARTSSIRAGSSLGSFMGDRALRMPPYIPPLISAGEASGHLGSSLIRSSHILDRTIDHSLKKMTSLIEPIMMAGMGIAVGSIALSIMMPIYDMSRALQP